LLGLIETNKDLNVSSCEVNTFFVVEVPADYAESNVLDFVVLTNIAVPTFSSGCLFLAGFLLFVFVLLGNGCFVFGPFVGVDNRKRFFQLDPTGIHDCSYDLRCFFLPFCHSRILSKLED